MNNNTIHLNGKNLRYGYTTGSCAAAAAKAATLMFFSQKIVNEVIIQLPDSKKVEFEIFESIVNEQFASCCVVKDAGDDPDVTNGIKIYAKAFVNNENTVKIQTGIGIGVVTKKGLMVAVGQPAINPIPMQMIVNEVNSVLPKNKGIIIKLSVPEGVTIAEKTFNPQLGIMGGISILGTKGVVVPMSDEAYKDSLALKLSMLQAQSVLHVVFTPGNYGERFINNKYTIDNELIVTTSNFIGFMLEQAVHFKMKKVLLVGHIGKLVKVAGGIFHTHSRVADARNEVFAAHYLLFSGNAELCKQIMHCNTTEEAVELVSDVNFYNYLSVRIKNRCLQYVKNELEMEVVLFSERAGLLGKTENADAWVSSYFLKK